MFFFGFFFGFFICASLAILGMRRAAKRENFIFGNLDFNHVIYDNPPAQGKNEIRKLEKEFEQIVKKHGHKGGILERLDKLDDRIERQANMLKEHDSALNRHSSLIRVLDQKFRHQKQIEEVDEKVQTFQNGC